MRAVSRAALVALLGAILASSALGASAPTVRIVCRAPLRISGAHFKAHELLRVNTTVAGEQLATRRVQTSVTGAFTLTLDPSSRFGGCSGAAVIRVARPGGGIISVRLLPRMCLPAAAP